MSNNKQEITKYLSLLFNLGFKIIISIGLCFAIGLWLDKQFETKIIFMMIGIILGLIASFYLLFKQIENLDKIE